MPAWTNFTLVKVGNIKEGSKTVRFNDTYFEVVKHENGMTELRCYEANPTAGYGEGVIVRLHSETKVFYDTNRQ